MRTGAQDFAGASASPTESLLEMALGMSVGVLMVLDGDELFENWQIGRLSVAQMLGQRARDAVAEAIRRASRDIDAGLYAARWQRATRGEQRFMQAMADWGGGPVLMSELVTALGKNRPRNCLQRATN